MSEAVIGFDYDDRKDGELSKTRAKLREAERNLADLQNTLRVVMTGSGAVIVVLLIVVFILASARPTLQA